MLQLLLLGMGERLKCTQDDDNLPQQRVNCRGDKARFSGAFCARFKTRQVLTLALCLLCIPLTLSHTLSHSHTCSHFCANYTHSHTRTHIAHTHGLAVSWARESDAFSALVYTFPPLCPAMTALRRLLAPSRSASVRLPLS